MAPVSIRNEIPARLAGVVAHRLVSELRDVCDRIEIAGSLRRKKEAVHDIDIVVLPKSSPVGVLQHSETPLDRVLQRLVNRGSLMPVRDGEKIKSFVATKTGVPIDLYIANEDTWATLLLIRTGSKNHNVLLAQRAQQLGMKLLASGEGIRDSRGDLIRISTEGEIFSLLKLPYLPPEKRG